MNKKQPWTKAWCWINNEKMFYPSQRVKTLKKRAKLGNLWKWLIMQTKHNIIIQIISDLRLVEVQWARDRRGDVVFFWHMIYDFDRFRLRHGLLITVIRSIVTPRQFDQTSYNYKWYQIKSWKLGMLLPGSPIPVCGALFKLPKGNERYI